ncbi:MAG: hypothetical protein Q9163_002195 [Psora crenata]
MESQPTGDVPTRNPRFSEPTLDLNNRSPSPRSVSGDGPHPSSASTSTRSAGESTDSNGSRGRRSRPSVAAVSSQLTIVREKLEHMEHKEQRSQHRGSSTASTERPPLANKALPEEAVVSSKQVLLSFSKVASKNVEKEEARRQQVDRFNLENELQRRVHQRLAQWEDSKYRGWTEYLLSWAIPRFRHTPPPHVEELKSLALHYYPPRAELKCHVCDFGEGRAEHKVVELGQLEEYMIVKPDWVDVRWIHAPLGLGLMHSSVEDIFLHEGEPGREFENAGRAGWPYLETEIFNFRHRDNVQEMRDVYLLLRDWQELQHDLDLSTWKADHNASLHHDVDWRADHLATQPTFWNLVGSDMPWQLSEGLSMGSLTPKDGLQPVGRHIEPQTLSMHPFYKDAHLVRDPFRTFHRGDGFLLTLSPLQGVNYLDKHFSKYLAEPVDAMFDNDDASAIGQAFQAFAKSGTSTWHRRTVEWFLVYLLTEVGVTPHPLRQGFNAPTLESVYCSVIQDLKRRRFEEWKPNVTVQLVREYLSCLDELTYITLNLQKKADLFKVMGLDVVKFETQDLESGKEPDNSQGESSLDRVSWAENHAQHQHECFERLLIDLKQSLDAVSEYFPTNTLTLLLRFRAMSNANECAFSQLFQLRSIEQNDMAIVSDSQNKAILIFTGVTIVFLPLSFFTSYFGMNVRGIANTDKTETYFWKVCGTVAFLIVLLVTLGAFKHNLRRLLRQRWKPPAIV